MILRSPKKYINDHANLKCGWIDEYEQTGRLQIGVFHQWRRYCRRNRFPGMVGLLFVSPVYMVWSVAISKIMERISGRDSVLPNVELMGGVTTAIVTQFMALPWLAASFRIGSKSPTEIQLLYDMGWLIFNSTFGVTVVQLTGFGIAILSDKRSVPLFPRWLAWLTFTVESTFLSACGWY